MPESTPTKLPIVPPSGGAYSPPEGSEQRLFGGCGPHEMWKEPDPTEQEEAQDKVDRLKAADEATAALTGDVGHANAACPSAKNKALEVALVDAQGKPVVGLAVELHRDGEPGLVSATSNKEGIARFEGLLAADKHVLWIPSLSRGSWSAKGAEALPSDRAEVEYTASWSKAPAKKERPAEHTVVDGECMWTIARKYGVLADELWDANTDLEKTKRNVNVLAPADVIKLPPVADEKPESVAAGKRTTVECTHSVAHANLRFQDIDGAARSNVAAVVRVICHSGQEVTWETTTNGDGCIDEPVPDDAKTVAVVLDVEPEPLSYHFKFAFLDPIETVAGVQGRLVNLGYWCGDERGELGPLTKRALREFQKLNDLEESGEIDGPTTDKIQALY